MMKKKKRRKLVINPSPAKVKVTKQAKRNSPKIKKKSIQTQVDDQPDKTSKADDKPGAPSSKKELKIVVDKTAKRQNRIRFQRKMGS